MTDKLRRLEELDRRIAQLQEAIQELTGKSVRVNQLVPYVRKELEEVKKCLKRNHL